MVRKLKRERHATAAFFGLAVSCPAAFALCPSIPHIDNAKHLSRRGANPPPQQVPAARCCSGLCFLGRLAPCRLLPTCSEGRRDSWRLEASRRDPSQAQSDGKVEQNQEEGGRDISTEAGGSRLEAAGARAAAASSIDHGKDPEEKRAALRRMRRKERAKIKVIPDASNNKKGSNRTVREKVQNVNMTEATAPGVSCRRGWGAGVRDTVVGKPLRFLGRKLDACRAFIASRERIHWVSLGMAIYIATSSLRPRLESPLTSTSARMDSNHHGVPEDAPSDGLHHGESRSPYGVARNRRGRHRQREDSGPHRRGAEASGPIGGVDTTVTRLDDHAEELWRDSPAVRAAAKAAASAAAAAAPFEGSLAPTDAEKDNLQPITEFLSSHGDEAQEGTPPSAPMTTGVHDASGEGVATDEEGIDSVEIPTDLRMLTDLAYLEAAAEKVLEMLPDKDIVGNDEGGGGERDKGGEGMSEGGACTGDCEAGGDGATGIVARDGIEKTEGQRQAKALSPHASYNDQGVDGARRGEEGNDLPPPPEPQEEQTLPGGSASAPDCAPDEERPRPARAAMTMEQAKTVPEVEEVFIVPAVLPDVEAKPAVATFVVVMEETVASTLPNPTVPRPAQVPGPDGVSAQGEGGDQARGRKSTSFVAVAARAVSPAVCRIDMERLVGTGQDVAFPDLCEIGQGSGVIFSSEDGLVLTNAHVVAGARKVTVTLTDGRKFLAEVKGSDELSDLAVLKIDRDVGAGDLALPAATLGDSHDLQVGDWVIAVGNPVGLDSTVTLGIVSSMKRSSEEVGFPERKVTFIQTDAAINPGNSGGPLVNEFGEVVGINTAIRAHTEGIGFAIPINKAKAIMHDLAEGNRIEYAYIGIHMTTITPDFAIQNNRDPNSHQLIPEVNGAIIMRVLPSTPASVAGLRRHDVVIEMRGRTVRTADEAKQVVDESRVGDVLTVKVLRGLDRVIELEVRARDMSEQLEPYARKFPQKSGNGDGNGDGNGGSGGGPSRAPRFRPRPFPGVSPPAFPWGSSPSPPAAETTPAVSPRRPHQDPEHLLIEREQYNRGAGSPTTGATALSVDEDGARLPFNSGGDREMEE